MTSGGASGSDGAFDQALFFLQAPFGADADRLAYDQAVRHLLEDPDRSHPALLHLLESGTAANPYAIIDLLPQFARSESIPVLEGTMSSGPANMRLAAAQALAAHPLDEACRALLRGLHAADDETATAAIAGLLARQDPAVCGELKSVLNHPTASVRYHAVHAAASLGCLERQALRAISEQDNSAQIRELAAQLMADAPEPGKAP